MSHRRKRIAGSHDEPGGMSETGEESAAEYARLKAFANLVCMQLPASPQERAEMRRDVDVYVTSRDVGYVFRCTEAKNNALDEWKMMLEVCIGELVYPEKECLSDDEDCGLAIFVEERLAVLTCGGLFGGTLASLALRTEVMQ